MSSSTCASAEGPPYILSHWSCLLSVSTAPVTLQVHLKMNMSSSSRCLHVYDYWWLAPFPLLSAIHFYWNKYVAPCSWSTRTMGLLKGVTNGIYREREKVKREHTFYRRTSYFYIPYFTLCFFTIIVGPCLSLVLHYFVFVLCAKFEFERRHLQQTIRRR